MSRTLILAVALSLLLMSTVQPFSLPAVPVKVPQFSGRGPHFAISKSRAESRNSLQAPTLGALRMVSNGESISTCKVDILRAKFEFGNDWLDQLGEESNKPLGDDEKAISNSKGFLIFGLSPTNPQDWITVVLTGIIVYETFDLFVFWFQKLTGFQGFQAQWKYGSRKVSSPVSLQPKLFSRHLCSAKLKFTLLQLFRHLYNHLVCRSSLNVYTRGNPCLHEFPLLVSSDCWMS
jgi:hypothetical protein